MTTRVAARRPWWITTRPAPRTDNNWVAGPFLTADEAIESRARIEKYTGKLTFWVVSEDES